MTKQSTNAVTYQIIQMTIEEILNLKQNPKWLRQESASDLSNLSEFSIQSYLVDENNWLVIFDGKKAVYGSKKHIIDGHGRQAIMKQLVEDGVITLETVIPVKVYDELDEYTHDELTKDYTSRELSQIEVYRHVIAAMQEISRPERTATAFLTRLASRWYTYLVKFSATKKAREVAKGQVVIPGVNDLSEKEDKAKTKHLKDGFSYAVARQLGVLENRCKGRLQTMSYLADYPQSVIDYFQYTMNVSSDKLLPACFLMEKVKKNDDGTKTMEHVIDVKGALSHYKGNLPPEAMPFFDNPDGFEGERCSQKLKVLQADKLAEEEAEKEEQMTKAVEFVANIADDEAKTFVEWINENHQQLIIEFLNR